MRFFHLADLHIGKNVNGFSMIEEQRYILNKIIEKVEERSPEVVLIAGDVYDKKNPSNEAVRLFDEFISKLTSFDLDILIVSGNHDAGDKLQFLSKILKEKRIYIVGSFEEEIFKVKIKDVNFYLLPFVRPSDVRYYYQEADTYHLAVKQAIENSDIDYDDLNVFVAHQFFAGQQLDLERSDSEQISVGGIDNVGYNLLEKFDYAALGHLHKAQQLGFEHIRYSGSPLKYSDSEVNHHKSFVEVNIGNKDDVEIKLYPLKAKTPMRKIKDYIENILKEDYDKDCLNDFVHIVLLNENEVIDAIGKLRNKYKNLMSLRFEKSKTYKSEAIEGVANIEDKNPIDLFSDFFFLQNEKQMNKRQLEIVKKLMSEEVK